MLAVELAEDDVAGVLPEGVAVAAVNGPTSVVVSGDAKAVEKLAEGWAAEGVRVKRLTVSHAFHSPLMEPMLADFAAAIDGLTFREPEIDGLPAQVTDPAYWVAHVREPVRFADMVTGLHAQGATRWLELGPDAVLTALAQQITDDDGQVFAPAMRRGRAQTETFLTALATLWTGGVAVDWAGLLRALGGRCVEEVPTYPFQREWFWLAAGPGTAGLAAAGLEPAGHPLLSAASPLPDTGGHLFTGRLARAAHPWLADHAVQDTVVLPPSAFLELALHAGDALGCAAVAELTVDTPLVVPGSGAVQLHVWAGPAGADGTRPLSISSRPEGGASDPEPAPWTRHATAVLATGPAREPNGGGDPAWPAPGAEPVDVADCYGRALDRGFDYGPVFQGLTRLWRSGGDLLAEIELPDDGGAGDAERFGVHPALLDAAVHAACLDDERPRLPVSWKGAVLHATGATRLRARLTPLGPDAFRLALTDPDGEPVAEIDTVTLAPVTGLRATAPAPESLYEIGWQPWEPTGPGDPTEHWTVVGTDRTGVAEALRASGRQVAEAGSVAEAGPGGILLPWPPDDGAADATGRAAAARVGGIVADLQQYVGGAAGGRTRLVVLTRGATAPARPGDVAASAVWGLVKAAQAELPGGITLVDLDGDERSAAAVPALLDDAAGAAEPQFAVREGRPHVPRLTRAAPGTAADATADAADPPFGDGTVLVTGGTGTFGSLIARHLAARHGVRDLLLVSRRGDAAPGAAGLAADLARAGAAAEFAACDLTDREAAAALLAGRRVTAVVHAADAVDDGVITSLTGERVEGVLGAKAVAAWHLHELTADRDLAAFVLFSSIAGVLGSPGQGGSAAANAWVNALAEFRRGAGLPAQALAWGTWAADAADGRRRRGVLEELARDEGLALFDEAVLGRRDGPAVLLPVRLSAADLRADAAAGILHPALRGLVRAPGRRRAGRSGTGDQAGAELRARLQAVPRPEQDRILLDLVRTEVAAAGGFAGPHAVDPLRGITELGLDSLAAVSLRNRLGALTGLRLPATLVFDYPTSTVMAGYLRTELLGDDDDAARPLMDELARLEAVIDLGVTGPAAGRAADRLRALAAKLAGAGADEPAGELIAEKLESATSQELFDFIDSEFGDS